MEMSTPKQSKYSNYPMHSPPRKLNGELSGIENSPWNTSLNTNGDDSGSPLSSCGGSPADYDLNKSFTKNTSCSAESRSESNNKRGRPRSEALTTLMIEGSTSPSAIKCKFCNRVFPRDKSLQAHLRIHTGERPYTCDYPGCTRAFTQSGQLKTHQRLHTGERPFVCSAKDCQMRFTHANRHCPDHPYDTLRRCDDDFVIQSVPNEEQSTEIMKWLQKYREERQQQLHAQNHPVMSPSSTSTPTTRKTPSKRSSSNKINDENKRRFKRFHQNLANKSLTSSPSYSNSNNAQLNSMDLSSNCDSSFLNNLSSTPKFVPCDNISIKSYQQSNQKTVRKGLMCELDMNAGRGGLPYPTSMASHSPAHTSSTMVQGIQNENFYTNNSFASPLSSGKFGKAHAPKVISWKEPTENDEDFLSDVENYSTSLSEMNSFTSQHDHTSSQNEVQQALVTSAENLVEDSPKQVLNPKKKWLREAWNDDLGTKPLEPNSNNLYPESNWQMGGTKGGLIVNSESENPNQMRPTVLMVASRDQTRPMMKNAGSDQPQNNYDASHGYTEDIPGNIFYEYGDNQQTDLYRRSSYPEMTTGPQYEPKELSYFGSGRTMSILEISPELIKSVKLKDPAYQNYYEKVKLEEPRSYLDDKVDLVSDTAAHLDVDIPTYANFPTRNDSEVTLEPTNMVKTNTEFTQDPQQFADVNSGAEFAPPADFNRKLFGALALMQLATNDLAVDYSLHRNQTDSPAIGLPREEQQSTAEDDYQNQSDDNQA